MKNLSKTPPMQFFSVAVFSLLVLVSTSCNKASVDGSIKQTASALQQDNAVAVLDSSLQVKGAFLTFKRNGDTIIMHGVNVPVFGSGWSNDVAAVAAAVKANTLANSVRINWYSKKVLAAIGNPPYYTNANLDLALTTYAAKGIIPVLSLHDLTALGNNTVAGFNSYVVSFWTDSAIVAILRKHKNHLILNLQNEWGATWAGLTGATFINTYAPLITKLRGIGITNPIAIDAPDGGGNSAFLITNGQALINKDPLKNILLSVHTYWSQENGTIVNCPADYVTKIKALATSKLPFVLGEVSDWAVQGSNGQDHESVVPVSFTCPGATSANKYAVNFDAILTEAYKDKIGFFAWAWYQDGLLVRNLYNQSSGVSINTSTHAGNWPASMLSATKVYGLKNPALNKVH
jgi:hypothetical protein